MNPSPRHAFTLVELSIVLVILGLLVGGVLAGQSLIRAAELKTVTREYTGYLTALHSFKDKYFAIPGDMRNAVKYWGAQAGPTTDGIDMTFTCPYLATPATGIATCNGDGDGHIENVQEPMRFWQHLTNAGMVAGSFSGILDPDTGFFAAGKNTPRSKLPGASWTIFAARSLAAGNTFVTANQGNILMFAKEDLGWPDVPVLKADDAYNIDKKMDDGVPHQGKIRADYDNSYHPDCVPASNNQYDLSKTTIGCALWFITGF